MDRFEQEPKQRRRVHLQQVGGEDQGRAVPQLGHRTGRRDGDAEALQVVLPRSLALRHHVLQVD